MIRILLLPPALISIYLVVINWVSMYQTLDIIGMPIIYELMAFGIALVITSLTYWFVVLPGSYLTLKLTGSRYAGLFTALVLAIVTTCILTTLDYPDLSWKGTVSIVYITQVIIPILFLGLYGYYLLARYLLNREESLFKVWLSPASIRIIFSVLTILFICVFVTGTYWNQKPSMPRITFLEQDKEIKGRVLIKSQKFVIENLLGKHGGFLSNDALPLDLMMDNMLHWEFGVQEQIKNFNTLLLSYNYFFIGNEKNTEASWLTQLLLKHLMI